MKETTGEVFVYFDIFTPVMKKFEAANIPFTRVSRQSELPCEKKVYFLKVKACVRRGTLAE
jgi:hypothetical protein